MIFGIFYLVSNNSWIFIDLFEKIHEEFEF